MQWMWAQYWSLWSRLHLSVWVWAVVLPLIVERNRSLSHEDFVGKVDAAWKAWLGDHPGVLPGLKLRVLASAARVVLLKQSEIEQVLRSSNRSLRKSGFSTQTHSIRQIATVPVLEIPITELVEYGTPGTDHSGRPTSPTSPQHPTHHSAREPGPIVKNTFQARKHGVFMITVFNKQPHPLRKYGHVESG